MGVTIQENAASTTPSPDRASGVVLLPSHLFFVREVSLPTGISPEEIASFVEVSLEQISPFALNQLYYGYYHPSEGTDLLMFAAYRKQLAVFEDDEWAAADVVLPDFAPILGLKRDGPTLVFLQDEHEVTAVYWAADHTVPDRVVSRAFGAEGEDQPLLEQVCEELERRLGPLPQDVKRLVFDRPREGSIKDRNLVFALRGADGAEASTEIDEARFMAMDVRDKDFLRATRKARHQNRLLWGGVLVMFAAFIALIIFEGALFAGRQILTAREERVRALEPEVAKIMEEEELAIRLEELSGERLLPFEMLDYLNQPRPASVFFTSFSTDGLRSFRVEAITPRSQDVDLYQRMLEQAEALQDVQIQGLRTQPDGRTSFTIAGTFSAGSLARGSISTASANAASPRGVPTEAQEQRPAPVGRGEAARAGGRGQAPVERTPNMETEI